jgi:hypothetical protein
MIDKQKVVLDLFEKKISKKKTNCLNKLKNFYYERIIAL